MKSFFLAVSIFLASMFGGQHATSPLPATPSAAAITLVDEQTPAPNIAPTLTATGVATNTSIASTTVLNAPLEANYVTQSELATLASDLRSLIYQLAASNTPAFTDPQIAANGDGVYFGEAAAPIVQINGSAITDLTASEIPDLSGSYLSTSGGTLTGTTTFADAVGVGTTNPLNALDIDGSGAFGTYAGTYIAPTDGLIVSGSVGIGTSTPGVPLEVEDTAATSTATYGSNIVFDGAFTSNPSSAWTLGTNWSWDSTNSRIQYSGVGGPIAAAYIGDGGSGYLVGDTVTVSGGTHDATYSVTSVSSSGAVTGISQVSAGTTYTSSGSPSATTGGTGSGLTIVVKTISNGATLTQTLSPSGPSATYYSTGYDGYITGVTYQVSFIITNYSGTGQVQVGIGTASPNTQLPYYFQGNGNFTLTLTSATPVITFTPTADFIGEISSVVVAPITPSSPVFQIDNTAGQPSFEIRAGTSQYSGSGTAKGVNTLLGVDAGRNTNDSFEGYNTAVGYDALFSNQSTYNNIAIGDSALFANTTGNNDVAVGESSMQNTSSGFNNVAVGFVAGNQIVSGYQNVAIGAYAGAPMSGYNSVAIGYTTLEDDITGVQNVAVGSEDMWKNRSGSNNTAAGTFALYGLTTGSGNTALGGSALDNDDTASNNTAVGLNALSANTTASGNAALGYESLQDNVNGGSNTGIGFEALQFATSSTDNTAVGDAAMAGINNSPTLTWGKNDTALGFGAFNKYADGSFDTALGYDAMSNATTSSSSVAVGYGAGQGKSTNDAYTGLTALGYQTGQNLSNNSNFNTLIGYQAGYNVTTGADNILIGSATSSTGIANLTTGSMNILLGDNISFASTTANGQLDIGNLVYGTGLNGNGSTLATGDIGIGNSSPYARLSVKGPDAASSTLAFNVVNSASTTLFAVFDGGNAQLSGTLTQSSDERLKTNIQSLDGSSTLALIDELNPVTFNWIDPNQDQTPQLGFIAQQVQQIFPNLVATTSPTPLTPNGTLGLNYIGLISPIISAIQALSGEVQTLVAEVQGFAQSFTSQQVTTSKLCLTDSGGTSCYTRSQIDAALANIGQTSSGSYASAPSDNEASTTPDTPPTITINGANPDVIDVGNDYSDLGATAKDAEGNSLDIETFLNGVETSTFILDTSAPATDTIDYVAEDPWGNVSTSSRNVIVQAAAATALQ